MGNGKALFVSHLNSVFAWIVESPSHLGLQRNPLIQLALHWFKRISPISQLIEDFEAVRLWNFQDVLEVVMAAVEMREDFKRKRGVGAI